MPFCGSCGKEVTPGNNFCEHCGAPVVILQPPPPPPVSPSQISPPMAPPAPRTPGILVPPVPPVPAPAGPKLKDRRLLIAGASIILVILIASAYFIGVPLMKTPAKPDRPAAPGTPAPTPAGTQTQVTTIPAGTTMPTIPVPTTIIEMNQQYEAAYRQVYSSNRTYMFGDKVSIPCKLDNPPLYIKFNISPAMVNRSILADIGLSTEHIVYAVYPDPNAWFEIQVLDSAGGSVVEKQGFGTKKGYSVIQKQEFMVRIKGDYNVEMSGNDVVADVRILTGTS